MSALTIESGIVAVTRSYEMNFGWVYAVSYL